jgi:protein ATS1
MAIYAFGSNGSGQLGLNRKDDTSIPIKCDAFFRPLRVEAGGNHTLIISASNDVYISGEMRDLLRDPQDPNACTIFRALGKKATFCSAAWEAATIADSAGVVYTWGYGDKGELGCGPDVKFLESPNYALDLSKVLPEGTTIVDLASGVHHTVLVLSDGSVLGWGNGRKGQLGEPAGLFWEPRMIGGLNFKVIRAVCGREFTYLVGDPTAGHHAILGTDKWRIKSDMPHDVSGWKDIGASWGSVFVLSAAGKVRSWGRNDHGQLAPESLPTIEHLAIGSEHAIALTEDEKVLVWGWGEHGNCGSEVDQNGDVKHRWNEVILHELGIEEVIRGVGAGCATSWIWTERH